MHRDEIREELHSIKIQIEEVIGACLGHAPNDFYSEDESGNEVIIMSKVKPFAKMADDALHRLYALVNKI